MTKPRTCSELIRERYKRPDSERGWRFVASNLLHLALTMLLSAIPYMLMALAYWAASLG